MIDNALYVNADGGKQILTNMQVIANNLANLNTSGFHADYKNIVDQHHLLDENRKAMVEAHAVFTNPKSGPVNYTGRELDVAVDGEQGYIAVQTPSGQMAYTRAGSMDVTSQGLLVTRKGDIVLGAAGVITIPQSSKVVIDKNGVVYAQPPGEAAASLAEVGRIKLVEAKSTDMRKGEDGLYYPREDIQPRPAVDVKLIPESLEGSNVDAIRCLTELIECSRQFDMHTKLMRDVGDNETKANQLLDVLT